MTKRQAILAAIAGAIGLMSSRAKTEPLTGTASTNAIQLVPQSVYFSLDTYAKFTFRFAGEEVTITSKEIFDALKSS